MPAPALKASELLVDSPPPTTAASQQLQECILLIEDSEDSMLLVEYALQQFGRGRYRLAWAMNLSDGLERLAQGGVHLVLLDLGLPESSGPASYAWVRQMSPEVPVLVLTGDSCEETEFSVLASGVHDYLIKDRISGKMLMQAIQKALHKEELRRQWKAVSSNYRFRWTLSD